MSLVNPVQDQVAVIGAASTGYTRDVAQGSRNRYTVAACVDAIRDCGLGRSDIDGVCGNEPSTSYVITALGLESVTYYSEWSATAVAGSSFIDGVNALYAGSCSVMLVYHSVYRSAALSRSARRDPFRRGEEPATVTPHAQPENLTMGAEYAAWADRYMQEFDVRRKHLGYVALNGRANAAHNPRAVMREPITMADYLNARMIREPLCLLDMDVPADGAVAFVLTTTARATLEAHDRPILVHATTVGVTAPAEETQVPGLAKNGQHLVADSLRRKSQYWLDDFDVLFPYDGFSFLVLSWIESLGLAERGGAGELLESSRDELGRIRLNGRVPINPHGGALSEGASQGAGHIYEAVLQLRGTAGARQVPNAHVALVTPGGFVFNAQGIILRRR